MTQVYLIVDGQVEEVVVALEVLVKQVDQHALSILVWNVADVDRRSRIDRRLASSRAYLAGVVDEALALGFADSKRLLLRFLLKLTVRPCCFQSSEKVSRAWIQFLLTTRKQVNWWRLEVYEAVRSFDWEILGLWFRVGRTERIEVRRFRVSSPETSSKLPLWSNKI